MLALNERTCRCVSSQLKRLSSVESRMHSWYSNKKASWVLARGFVVLMIGVVVGAWLDVESNVWVIIVGVPILLTAISFGARRSTQSKSLQRAREPLP